MFVTLVINLIPNFLYSGISFEFFKNLDPITILYAGNKPTHNPVSHGTSVIISTIKYTSIEHPIRFYGIPSVIFLILGSVFTYSAVQYYAEIGRLSTNLTILGAGTFLVGIILLITAILLYSLISIAREGKN